MKNIPYNVIQYIINYPTDLDYTTVKLYVCKHYSKMISNRTDMIYILTKAMEIHKGNYLDIPRYNEAILFMKEMVLIRSYCQDKLYYNLMSYPFFSYKGKATRCVYKALVVDYHQSPNVYFICKSYTINVFAYIVSWTNQHVPNMLKFVCDTYHIINQINNSHKRMMLYKLCFDHYIQDPLLLYKILIYFCILHKDNSVELNETRFISTWFRMCKERLNIDIDDVIEAFNGHMYSKICDAYIDEPSMSVGRYYMMLPSGHYVRSYSHIGEGKKHFIDRLKNLHHDIYLEERINYIFKSDTYQLNLKKLLTYREDE